MANREEPAPDDVMARRDRRWVEVQLSAYTAWINLYLNKRPGEVAAVSDLVRDLTDGVRLIRFFELLTDKTLQTKWASQPKTRIQKIDNMAQAIDFARRRMLVDVSGISAENLVDGDEKQVIGFMFILHQEYNIKTIRTGGKTAEEALLLWVQEVTKDYAGVHITDYKTSFRDGLAFLALCDSYVADTAVFDYTKSAKPEKPLENLRTAFDLAERHMGVPRLLQAEELANGDAEERSIVLALSTYFHAFKANQEQRDTKSRLHKMESELHVKTKNLELANSEIARLREAQAAMDAATRELERLRQELGEQKAKNTNVQPGELWSKAVQNKSFGDEPPVISIPFATEEKSLGKAFSSYHIRVQMQGKIWVIKRRYKEFDGLYSRLCKDSGKLPGPVPSIPPKKAFGNRSAEFVDQRRLGLEKFLTEIVAAPVLPFTKAFSEFIAFDSISTLIDVESFKQQQLNNYKQMDGGGAGGPISPDDEISPATADE